MPKRKQPPAGPKAKQHRAGQIDVDEMKREVLNILPGVGGLTLSQIVAHPTIVAHAVRIYGSVDRRAVSVLKNFLLCGLDTRFTELNGQYTSNPGGVDGRRSITKSTLVRVRCLETGKTCVVTNVKFLAELMFGRHGRDGAHAALMQNNGKQNRFKGYTWDVVLAGNATHSAEGAHAFFANEEYIDAESGEADDEVGAGSETESEDAGAAPEYDAGANIEHDSEEAGDCADNLLSEPDTENEDVVESDGRHTDEERESIDEVCTDASAEFAVDVDTD